MEGGGEKGKPNSDLTLFGSPIITVDEEKVGKNYAKILVLKFYTKILPSKLGVEGKGRKKLPIPSFL